MAIHTFTLGREPIRRRDYCHIKRRLYGLSEAGEVPLWNGRIPDQIHIKTLPGITLKLSNSKVPRIELKINPARLLGGSYADLCPLTEFDLLKVIGKVDWFLTAIEADFRFEDMSLTRIDCTMDVDCTNSESPADLIGCIQRSKLGRGYERISFGSEHKNYKEKNKHSFRVRCNDICLTVYDKSFQLKEENLMPKEEIPPNRLRFEVAFENSSFQRVLPDATVFNLDVGEKIMHFSGASVRLLQKYFGLGIMPGRFMRFDLAMAEIEKSNYTQKIKERMKQFMHAVAREYKHGVDGVGSDSGFTPAQVSYLLKCFQELDLHPAPLPHRSKCAQFPSISQMLDEGIPAQ